MKAFIFILMTALMLATQTSTGQTTASKEPPKAESFIQTTYTFMNFFAEDQFVKSVFAEPNTYYYTNCVLCNTYPVDHVKEFLDRVSENDTGKTYIDSLDMVYFRRQISSPSTELWDKKQLKTAKITDKPKVIQNVYSVSIPLFTRDRKSALIFMSTTDYTRCYLYTFNAESQRWELVTMIWHEELKFASK